MKNILRSALISTALLMALSIGGAAQSMAGTVKTTTVKFAPGKKQATLRGTASYAMSYVYNFTVKKGQKISVITDSAEPELTFSLFSPKTDGDSLAFNAKEWSGESTEAGIYSITLVMNNEEAIKVPYSITVKVQ